MLRITPEHQYMLLSLTVILLLHKYSQNNILMLVMIALLIGLAILTRTIGISLLVAFFIHMIKRDQSRYSLRSLVILCIGLIPAAVWHETRPDIGHSYISDMVNIYSKQDLQQIFLMLGSSIKALGTAWIQNIALRPEAVNELHLITAIIVGLFILPGLVIRKNSPETLYVLSYLGITVIWPYPDEMPRFLYPVMPFLILYAYTGLTAALNALHWNAGKFIVAAAIALSVYAPSALAIYERHTIGYGADNARVTYIPELYTIHSRDKAFSTAVIWHETLNFMESLKPFHEGYGLTLTIKPQFFTFLSDIYAEKIPQYDSAYEKEYFDYLYRANAKHLLITTIPITTSENDVDIVKVLQKVAEERFSLVHMNNDRMVNVVTMMDMRQR